MLYIPFAFYLDREPARKQIVRLRWTCLFEANSSTGWQTRTRPKITSVFRGRAEARHHDVKVTLKGGGGESPGSRYGSLALCSLRGGRYSPHSSSII